MSDVSADSAGEIVGLSALDDVLGIKVESWFDCGNMTSLLRTKKEYAPSSYNILEKEDEAIWFKDDLVIKFSKSKDFISDRIERSMYLPKEALPKIIGVRTYAYAYQKSSGDILSENLSVDVVNDLLDWMKKRVWSVRGNPISEEILASFYNKKSFDRAKLYHSRYEFLDREIVINDKKCPKLCDLLNKINWSQIYQKAIPVNFHGDFHPENILVDSGKFILLDWRQNFGEGNKEFGDLYYDLAKFMHGLLVSHPMVARNQFSVKWISEHKVKIDIQSSTSLEEAKKAYYKWLDENEFDIPHVELLTAIIFINIAALHEQPYGEFLYLLAVLLMTKHVIL